ncbi:hypothetical protein ABZX85_37465 [Streptomyces sp. NPDC004539]|uniref:hypothetical protein n=1 Tax=Streptomyces sp. NPDC004539 TaxID=3154280 RepID=UPI0033A06323
MIPRPEPGQITEVTPAYAVPPPALPWPPVRELTVVQEKLPKRTPARGRRVRRRTTRLLRDDAFWSGVLTAISVATLVIVVAATTA